MSDSKSNKRKESDYFEEQKAKFSKNEKGTTVSDSKKINSEITRLVRTDSLSEERRLLLKPAHMLTNLSLKLDDKKRMQVNSSILVYYY